MGYLRYHDLNGTEWQTHFRVTADGVGNIRVEILVAEPTSKLGEPAYTAEGWQNQPAQVSLWRVTVRGKRPFPPAR